MAWYLIQTKAKAESIAENNLIRQEFSIYCPRIKTKTRKGDVIEVLFPGYIFIDLDLDSHWEKIRSTKGVIGLVRFTQYPAKIKENVISVIKENERIFNEMTEEYYKHGELIRIKAGSLEGLTAVFQEMNGDKRVFILLDILGKATRINLAKDQIEKV